MPPTNQPNMGFMFPSTSPYNLPSVNHDASHNQFGNDWSTANQQFQGMQQSQNIGLIPSIPPGTNFANGMFDTGMFPPFMATPFPNTPSILPSTYSNLPFNNMNNNPMNFPMNSSAFNGLNDKPSNFDLLPSISSTNDKKSIKEFLNSMNPVKTDHAKNIKSTKGLPSFPSSMKTLCESKSTTSLHQSRLLSSSIRSRTEVEPTVQNIVSTVNLDCRLDLQKIALNTRNAEYNPKTFAAVIMRIREPRTTALIFASGKLVCTGAKTEDDSRLAARKYARIIQKLGFPVKFKGYKIHNVVASVDVRFPIRLESFQLIHAQFCSYEPELFPGLIYRMLSPRVCLIIFVSGKVIITGAKEKSKIHKAFENILPVLKEFQKIVKPKVENIKEFKKRVEQLKN